MKVMSGRFKLLVTLLTTIAGLWMSFPTRAQHSSLNSIFVLPDSVEKLSLDEFYRIILAYHPVVKQANLLSAMAQQEIRLARGNFDPKLVSSFNRKEFQEKTYYNKLDAYLVFPTWFPVNPKIGYERNVGDLLNNENVIFNNKQVYAGISIPIGRGLFTDERRNALRQAELFTDIATADQVRVINKILLEASKDYWNWYHTFYQYRLSSKAVVIADEIFRRVKVTVELGEAAQIDTVQAKITLQSRLVERQEAWLNFQNATIAVSNYIWDEDSNPLDLSLGVAPVKLEKNDNFFQDHLLNDLIVQAKHNHPDLIKLSVKLNQLELDRSLAQEFLKPQLDLNYYILSQPAFFGEIDPLNNYKLGVDFSFPILLRKERSKLALSRLKIQNTTFQRTLAERDIVNQINLTFNELANTRILITQQDQVVKLYDRLLMAEMLNLENGESDLFKINIQQEKLLQAQSKLLKLNAEVEKQKALLYWAAGSNLKEN